MVMVVGSWRGNDRLIDRLWDERGVGFVRDLTKDHNRHGGEKIGGEKTVGKDH